jgi:hypothetical protein
MEHISNKIPLSNYRRTLYKRNVGKNSTSKAQVINIVEKDYYNWNKCYFSTAVFKSSPKGKKLMLPDVTPQFQLHRL